MAWQSALELTPDYVRAIGMISIENANLESAMATLFSRIIGAPHKIGRVVYLTPKSASARSEVFRSAARASLTPGLTWQGNEAHQMKMKDALQRTLAIASKAEAFVGQRHGIIHDLWGIDSETDEVERRSLGLPAKTDGKVSLEALEKLITDIRGLIDEARTLADEFRHKPPYMVDMRLDSPAE